MFYAVYICVLYKESFCPCNPLQNVHHEQYVYIFVSCHIHTKFNKSWIIALMLSQHFFPLLLLLLQLFIPTFVWMVFSCGCKPLLPNESLSLEREEIHNLRKKYFRAPFLVLQVVTNRGLLMDPKIPIMVLPGTIWSFQVLNRVLYLWQPEAPKKVLWSTFFLRV